MNDTEERVERGARLLDEIAPGWETRINLETLDLESTYSCICGQLFAENGRTSELSQGPSFYQSGFDWFACTLYEQGAAWAKALGAKAHTSQFGFDIEAEEYEELQDAWIDLIKDRFNSGTLSA